MDSSCKQFIMKSSILKRIAVKHVASLKNTVYVCKQPYPNNVTFSGFGFFFKFNIYIYFND